MAPPSNGNTSVPNGSELPSEIYVENMENYLRESEQRFHHLEVRISLAKSNLDALLRQREQDLAALTSLRCALAPHNKLPPEILSEIFQHYVCEPVLVSAQKGSVSPRVLTQVCSKWRAIAFATQSLWNDILVECGDWKSFNQLINITHEHLQYSRSMPISLRTIGQFPQPDRMSNGGFNGGFNGGVTGGAYGSFSMIRRLVFPIIGRLRDLTLSFPSPSLQSFLETPPSSGADLESLETVELVYNTSQSHVNFNQPIEFFYGAPRLREFTLKAVNEWPTLLATNSFRLPWAQLTDLHFIRFSIPVTILPEILGNCHNLVTCTLTIIKDTDAPNNPVRALPSIRFLTLLNPVNSDYNKYLEGVAFPSLERLTISLDGQGRNGKKWSQSQFSSMISRSGCSLQCLSTSGFIEHADIECVLGDVPSLVELDVLAGQAISQSTLRFICNGLMAPKLEVLKCVVESHMLPDFLDMLDCRYVPRKSRAAYRGIRSVVISCEKRTQGYGEVAERLEEFRDNGRDIVVRDHWIRCCE